MTLELQVASVRWPVRSLGPGRRVVVWTQGCSLGCSGCISRSTWRPKDGHTTDASQLGLRLAAVLSTEDAGLTISGGEPLEQTKALRELLGVVRDGAPHSDVLMYTGYSPHELQHRDALEGLVDCYIAGRYIPRLHASEHWRGSTNQELLVASENHRALFNTWSTSDRPAPLEVSIVDGTATVVGIPARGALSRFQQELKQRGVDMQKREWVAGDE